MRPPPHLLNSGVRDNPKRKVTMQHGVTGTRDYRLTQAAEGVEALGAGLGLILRESRIDVFQVVDEQDVRLLGCVMDDNEAEDYARRITVARLTISSEPGVCETVGESYDEVLCALRRAIPELDSFEMVEADADELPVADPEGAVVPCTLDGLWYRSKSERKIAHALEAANVMFAPNASVRLGVTPDHRDTMEPDFLVWQDRNLGVLEVDGPWHQGRAADDHERDRRLKEHGVRVVERYPADRCYSMPDDVVADFLRLLRLNG
jgi:uncharacterized protein DUF559